MISTRGSTTTRDQAESRGVTARPPFAPLLALRRVMVGLAGALAVALIARENVVIGAIIGALAFTRAAMLVMWRRRQAVLARRFPRRFHRGPQNGTLRPPSSR